MDAQTTTKVVSLATRDADGFTDAVVRVPENSAEAIATIRELANIESESDFRSETIKAQELLVARNLALATRDVLDDFEKVLSSRQEYMLIKTPAIDPPGVTDYLTTYIGSIFFGFIVGAFI